MIAATHYLQARERHFEDVVAGGATISHQTGQKQGPAAAEDCVHICVQSKAAAISSDSHEVRQHRRKHAIVRNDASRCDPKKTVLVGDEGLEPPTPSV